MIKSRDEFGYIFWLLAMFAAIMSIATAMGVQYFLQELPCPLCLLQRIGFFGFIFGAMMHFKGTSRFRAMGIGLLLIVILMVMSVRQSLLDIYPRPGHEWIGPAVFGMHLPIWTFVGCLLLLLSIALDFIFIERDVGVSIHHYPRLKKIANVLTIVAIVLCAINLVSAFLQCGFESCHTYAYRLLPSVQVK